MSHYMYKDKKFLEINGKILPLILYADSSVTDGYSRKHPAHWFIDTLGAEPALLIDKKLYQEAADKKVQERIDWLNRYYPDEIHTLDSYNPYGDTYRGNSKLRGMKSFLSCKKTISAEEFLSKDTFSVRLSPMNEDTKTFHITTSGDIVCMDKWYREYRIFNLDKPVCIGVSGLLTEPMSESRHRYSYRR